MLEYIYFVKCPGCEDEHFDFFNEAKDYAVSLLSKKPIITQIEIDRNDFGECVDSCDLGTVWSWEEMMSDVPTEPDTVFTKADTFCDCRGKCGDNCKCGKHHEDPEFVALDNSVDFEFEIDEEELNSEDFDEAFQYDSLRDKEYDDALDALDRPLPEYRYTLDPETGKYTTVLVNRDQFTPDELAKLESCKKDRKPIPEGMTIDQLKEAMEANEDTVECAGCEELFSKEDCFYKDGIGWLCSDCEDSVVRCTWCGELFDKSECRYEADMGWLCRSCQSAIMSRGDQLTFRENTYWDFLDEDATTSTEKSIKEAVDSHDLVELEYPSLTVTLYGHKRDVDDWDEFDHTDSFVFLVPKVEVATAIWENWITDEDVVDVEGGLETLEDDIAWEKFLETHFDTLFEKYNKQILAYFEDEAREDFRERAQEEYSLDRWSADTDSAYDAWRDAHYFGESKEKQKPFLDEFDDAETRKVSMIDCPECGAVSYDMKEQYCANCGLGL